jgi:hypothetical protein
VYQEELKFDAPFVSVMVKKAGD